jgi:hypothetical protein
LQIANWSNSSAPSRARNTGEPLGDHRLQDLVGSVLRHVVDDRNPVEHRQIVADERFDQIRFVADDRATADAHRRVTPAGVGS